MAAKAVGAPETKPVPSSIGEDLFFVAMPMVTYRSISDEATKRGLTFSQAMQQALTKWMDTEQNRPQLLVEQGKKENGP